MCGIVAIWGYQDHSPPVDREELIRIRDQMANRGPDGKGEWYSPDRKVGLGHRRLAILDLSEKGAQPMLTPEQKLAISFNGEIYNFKALRSLLETKGYTFQSNTDTEVLLHLYREYGQKMVHHLRGMFAFALWDETKKSLLLARDPFGIKPLYYADDGKTVRVASQVKALLAGDKIKTTPDPAGHAGFFLWGHLPEPYTLYKEIRELPAGTTLQIDSSGKKEVQNYFNVSERLAAASNAPKNLGEGEQSQVVKKALMDSIEHHLVSDVPVGIFLSSGLDSSTVLALASEIRTTTIHTVTLGFKEYQGTALDETPLAEKLARQYRTDHQTIWISKEEFQADVPKIFDAMDQPTIDGVNTYFVSKVAVISGLKVCLSGLGGDELFGGYSSFNQVPSLAKKLGFLQSIPGLGKSLRWGSYPILKQIASPKLAGIFEYGNTLSGAYLLRRGLFMPWELKEVLDREMVKEGLEELQTVKTLSQTAGPIHSNHAKISALETTWYMRNQLLRDADWAGMAHSLEIRTPLVDKGLFEEMAPLLVSQHPPSKQTAAQTFQHPLPSEVLNRRKTGFTVPVHEWLLDKKQKGGRGLRGWAKKIKKDQFNLPEKICIYRFGQLGDTICALPAIQAIKNKFSPCRLTLLSDIHPGTTYPQAHTILSEFGIIDNAITYNPKKIYSIRSLIQLRKSLRMAEPRKLFYLVPLNRSFLHKLRDLLFFKWSGIQNIYGLHLYRKKLKPNGAIHEVDQLVSILKEDNIDISNIEFSIPLNKDAFEKIEKLWNNSQLNGRKVIAVAFGSKMPLKKWNLNNYMLVGRKLIEKYGVFLILIGGEEDSKEGDFLVNAWGVNSLNLAGKTNFLESAEIFRRSLLFLGNDSGAMHLAAAVGTPCVAIFSSRDSVGKWYPYGKNHTVLRKEVECQGCMLTECVENKMKCINSIAIEEVLLAFENFFLKDVNFT